MWHGPLVWIGGLVISAILLAFLVVVHQRWRSLIVRVASLDENDSEAAVTAATGKMEQARYLTFGLALLSLVPMNPAVFAFILRHPKLHAVLSIAGIVYILGAGWKAIFKLNLGMLFPTRPSWSAILRNAGIGLCLGFILSLGWQLVLDEPLRHLVVESWSSKAN
jgi:hypothetical protein